MCSRAEAYMGKGNLDSALKDLNAVLALNPNNVHAHMDRGKLFERRGDQWLLVHHHASHVLASQPPSDQ